MIPKILHYCWFGRGQMGPVALKCMESWKKYCPDYQIKVWNEDNFDIGQNTFVKEAYEEKKWAFVTDYVRLYALYTEGGIYLDSDIELLKNLDDLLSLGGVVIRIVPFLLQSCLQKREMCGSRIFYPIMIIGIFVFRMGPWILWKMTRSSLR